MVTPRKYPRGQFNRRVTFLSHQETSLGAGRVARQWLPIETLPTVWGSVTPLATRDRAQGDRVSAEVTHTIEVRYRTDVLPSMRITCHGHVYAIVGAPIDVDDAHVLLRCSCVLVVEPPAV